MTNQITKFDRSTAKEVGAEVAKALQEVADKFGITFDYKGGTFDPEIGTFSVKGDFSVADAKQAKFEQLVPYYAPLTVEDFNREFTMNGKTLRIVGLNNRAPKSPVLLEDNNGGQYKAPLAGVVRALGRSMSQPSVTITSKN